jgi:hypothetical protein
VIEENDVPTPAAAQKKDETKKDEAPASAEKKDEKK